MKLIHSKAEYIPQENTLDGLWKQIELAGRLCYKSEPNDTIEGTKKFVDSLIAKNHYSPLEFGTVYLVIPYYNSYEETELVSFFKYNPYSMVTGPYDDGNWYITTNYRVIVENNLNVDKYITSAQDHHILRITMKFTCSRAIAQEITRHRKFSYCMESQRYCNYTKDKFDSNVVFIKPSFMMKKDMYLYDMLRASLEVSEHWYKKLIEEGCKPEEAREVLPNATKTEIMVCGFAEDWEHFFGLRYFGTTGKPHPEMLDLTTKAKAELERNNLWKIINPNKE